MPVTETVLTGEVQGALLTPEQPNGLGVIVLTGSSGRVDAERARLFAERGAVALAQRWWGGEGQAPGVNQIPLEVFVRGVDRLKAEGCERIAVLGVPYGSAAALLTAVHDPRVDVAIAISPAHVVWQSDGPGIDGAVWPPRSSFTWAGTPLPFMVWDPRGWPPFGTPQPSYRAMYEQSLRTFAEDVPAASIPVEQARADIVLVAGRGDALWPSDLAAHALADRLEQHGRKARLIEHPDAGHSPVFPGETTRPAPVSRAWGGTAKGDRALGADAWAEISRRLGLSD